MTTFNKNRGYVGYSMSVRAMEARRNGSFPKTEFKKEYVLTEKAFKAFERAGIIYVSEWHHTSKSCNRTDFYSWSEDNYDGIYAERYEDIKAVLKKIKKAPKWDESINLSTEEGKAAYMEYLQLCDELAKENGKHYDELKSIFEGNED